VNTINVTVQLGRLRGPPADAGPSAAT